MGAMSRRDFLLAGAGLLAAAACGGGDDGGDSGGDSAGTTGTTRRRSFELVVASFVHVAGIDERLTLAFLNSEGTGPIAIDGPVKVTVDGREVDAELHRDGIPLPYLLVRHRFEAATPATVTAQYKGDTAEVPVDVRDPGSVKIPFPGKPMISAPSPTTADALGVDPICTREPPCPLHEVSLDAALAEKRPLAVLFSTPARCQSQLCGPVLDNLLVHHEAFADRVRFVHVEIYAARSGNAFVPTVKAYGLQSEPVLFLAGADGVVRERLDNAFDRAEAKSALQKLVS